MRARIPIILENWHEDFGALHVRRVHLRAVSMLNQSEVDDRDFLLFVVTRIAVFVASLAVVNLVRVRKRARRRRISALTNSGSVGAAAK